MTTKTNKESKSQQVKALLSEFLQHSEAQELVNRTVSQDILNYFNHKTDIAVGLADAIASREYTPFYDSGFNSLRNLVSKMDKYFEEDCGMSSWQIHGALKVIFSKYLAENWPSIVSQRLMIEDNFKSPDNFIALRRFVIVLKGLGINFYTKDYDGGGPDIIGNLVTTDLVHSSYEKMSTVQNKYLTPAAKNAMKGFRSNYGFANLNPGIINDNRNGKEFFGPVSYESYFRFLKLRKEKILDSLNDLAERLSLPITIELNFRAKSDRIVFDMVWERKLPEVFHDISRHTTKNRFS